MLLPVPLLNSVQLDLINCGVDHDLEVSTGNIELQKYPWSGILYYIYNGEDGETRAVTMVVLIQKEFVLGSAADIGPISNRDFREYSRVLLGENWIAPGRRVRNYVLHPEYGDTYNTLALVQLKDIVRDANIRPVCPPPERLRNPTFYVVKFENDYTNLEKKMIQVEHIPGNWCKEFYVKANLYSLKMRPPHVACVVSLDDKYPCVWNAGSALVSRDVWGRWQLLGLGVRGPGCGAPSRFLDIMSYDPWIRSSLAKFQRITISEITRQKYVLRSDGGTAYQRFGDCDEEETHNLIFREVIVLRTDNNQYQFLTYNLTLMNNVNYRCLTLELVNASGTSEMRVTHHSRRYTHGPACYTYRGTIFDISVYIMFSDKCVFQMYIWGDEQNMVLLDKQKWKWEEGTYYEDFTMSRVEYRGQTYMTDFGYEPLDYKMWIPEYDVWTTTEFDNSSWSSTTPPPSKESGGAQFAQMVEYRPTVGSTTTTRTKKKFKRKTTTTKPTTKPPTNSTLPATNSTLPATNSTTPATNSTSPKKP
ncbi:uncharacterized protein LOC114240961 isoform X1 [Bombyx mandarina]|uniref:Uncharacterized protein LOC114240961 isoform X1 n=1 Tax=Bombyx mandarina TaxID=7092 RepID=A0A6J2JDA7_BOMMA|nr:uncharacterized protein LOC114240961 isoform X1 [Bombyx mandarina]